jgi:uncharacterized protein YndB with AHSA1/START domain
MTDATRILEALKAGDPRGADDLVALVHGGLRRQAADPMARERPDHSLSATELVHEAYVRLVGAPNEQSFDGWLDPKCPGTPWSVAAKLVLDPKVDGLFDWLFINEAGERKPHYGRFTVVDRPSRVQYTWMSLHTRGLESLVTVTFEEKGDDTLMSLRHENLPDDECGRGHEQGWGKLLSGFADGFSRVRHQP